MQTTFTPEQLADSATRRSNEILRSCVHCGFCTATCPTYQVLGDELDSPRGRIYLIKDMLENDKVPDEATVRHIDRCLGCLSCMSTCPSGVDYMHLVDHARSYIEEKYERPLRDRLLRGLLAWILPYPGRFRLALKGARLARPFRRLLPDERLRAMIDMAPAATPAPSPNDAPQVFPAQGVRRKRVALLIGCAQRALNTDINDATIRLLRRLGCEVVVPKGLGCCGALPQHMGKEEQAHGLAADNIRALMAEVKGQGLDAVIINTSGCGTTVKDYGQMFRDGPMAQDAAKVAALAKDVTEFVATLGLGPASNAVPLRVAYHSACSLQHGQQIKATPKELLSAAGFTVVEPRNAHLCCGSAGTYNLLQPKISAELKARKVETLEELKPDVISAGNIGCMMQIGSATGVPVIHTVELLDWATGGPKPRALAGRAAA
ncbi:glycolate oxidase subunit GlcF [Paenirhodobacter populi]|uniref:glycolate oxidase subunit GlcF n=1 Tax=Paenirhodobacter populi TaxID=2306993 RepID=UPI000FE3A69D|nr:glycolate oxidase subunit GlcF [Sinirhodobacter populi]RWR06848.1 glycolate oxidase iron-sulfur subunit [Sinirhodobacter populi]RWR07431.1 glycolate oxidase iron-sulfur subunit [Sinirhodobacter populi]